MATTAKVASQDALNAFHEMFGNIFDPDFDEKIRTWMRPRPQPPRRDPPPPAETVIGEMTDLIVRRYRPLAIILFGSRASGTARPGSDIDLLVVLDAVDDKRAAATAIRGDLYWSEYPKDIIVTCSAEIVAARGDRTSFITDILDTGKCLYDRRG